MKGHTCWISSFGDNVKTIKEPFSKIIPRILTKLDLHVCFFLPPSLISIKATWKGNNEHLNNTHISFLSHFDTWAPFLKEEFQQIEALFATTKVTKSDVCNFLAEEFLTQITF